MTADRPTYMIKKSKGNDLGSFDLQVHKKIPLLCGRRKGCVALRQYCRMLGMKIEALGTAD